LRVRREAMPSDFPLQIELSGIVYGTQSAVVEDILFDAIPLPLTSLAADSLVHAVLLEITSQAEELAQAVNYLSADLRRAAGADPIPWDRGQRPGDMVLHALDPLVRRLLVGLRAIGEDVDQIERGQLAWEQVAWQRTWEIAEQVFSTAAPTTFAGRIDQKKNKEGNQEGKKTIYRMSTAEASFHRRLNQILTRAAEARRTPKRPATKAEAVPTNAV
ncbi:type I-E CRISPR-associated protein Cse1/CasA, partial [Frankia sp. Cr1]|uniref:type I-E CRISPR-associated protein Cse1/CasA n=1 Tax=Frankia sp. Cr1 TaxID=3073931 RepID=UPI002AD44BB2